MLRQMQTTLRHLVLLALLARLVACTGLQDVTPSYIPDRNGVAIDSVIVETAATFVATATSVGGSSPSPVLQGKSVGPQTLAVQVQPGKTVNETLQELAALSGELRGAWVLLPLLLPA